MKTNIQLKKISFKKLTISSLNQQDLSKVNGGGVFIFERLSGAMGCMHTDRTCK